ncbi:MULTISPECIES: sulfotransferase family 2 domain-containing protein [unclassified Thioalkalivibrio]|uniref:sulfotransferase family 2 domain-containing protein n=1 Tax=unclassified Thioalkalivibrio TaxID=2621013 RepID=UPI00039E2B21|nr:MULTISPECIES: sulfotransferase family 2 domain-containing protein [unclassified Thioalkalivibrio]
MFRSPDQAIVFLHIPKTGGSSIAKAVGRRYRGSRYHVKAAESRHAAARTHDINAPGFEERMQGLRSDLLLYAAESGTRYLTGHVWYTGGIRSLQKAGYQVLTCLRDPVDRFISNFLYNRFKTTPHMRTSLDIDSYLSSPEARSQATTYVRYLTGGCADRVYETEAAVKQAKAAIHELDGVGFLDEIRLFAEQIEALVGARIKIPHERRNPAPDRYAREIKNSSEIRDRVSEMCAYDIELYRYARALRPSVAAGES